MSGRILIVDDHEIVRKGLRSLISTRPGWTVCAEAANGLEGVEKARALRPDVVLMDIAMPEMNGLEATRIIRQDVPDSKVIIISQNEASVGRRQAKEVDAAAYIAKGDLSIDLISTLTRFLGPGTEGPSDASADVPVVPSPHWLEGGGQLGTLIRELDWSRTPLGLLQKWPQSLKTSVNLILNSRHPMWIGWGREGTFLYNDAYIPVLSLAKHPAALGKPTSEVWPEIWDIISPLIDNVYEKGGASFVDDVRLLMNRGEWMEETYYSFSYSPIRDESGEVAGLFCPSTNVTPKVVNARRLATISELSARTLLQKSTDLACASAATTISKNIDDIPFAILYLIDPDHSRARLQQTCGVPIGTAGLTLREVDLGNEGPPESLWPLAQVAKTGQSRVVPVGGVEGLPLGTGQQQLSQALVLPVTLRGEGGTVGILVAGVSPAQKLDLEYQTFFELVANQIAAAIQNARSAEEERKRLEALAEIDRAKTTFFSNVSHEFRTPLTLMLGPVDDLLANSYTNLSPAAKSQLELVNRNGNRLLRLVNTLLDFSRIEAGRMQALYQPTDLCTFTLELASVFRSATDRAGLQLELDCRPLPEPVFVDRGMWEKIVLNLISNAFKFTFEGKISVALAPDGENVELRVSDTGVGIPAHELPRLFDRFHRVENTRSRTHEGTGIGLALVQELVKLHDGSVRVESVIDQGTTFAVSIPFGKDHLPADRIGTVPTGSSTSAGAAPFVQEALRWLPETQESDLAESILPGEEAVIATDGQSSPEKRPYLLIADDNSDMRHYLARLLSQRYEVRTVADGQEALSAVWQRIPELILSDVMMPNFDGFSLVHALRADPLTRGIPIILLSARAGEESRVEGMEHGADDYLVKPFSARELLARVHSHLEIARMRKRSEDVSRRRMEQFEALLNAAPLGVYLVDGDFRIRAANPQAMKVFGHVPDVIGRDLAEVVRYLWPKDLAEEVAQNFRHTLETGEPIVTPEWAGQRADSGLREVYSWQINRIPLPDGGHGVVCYFQDISRQVQARETVAASEERLRLATEAAELGIWHWYPSQENAIWENDRVYEIFGRSRQDGPFTFTQFSTEVIHPDDADAFLQTMGHSLKTGVRFFFEGRVRHKDGTYVWAEFTAQVQMAVDGSPQRVLGTARDITERKRAEETLRQNRERINLFGEAIQVGFWFCDLPFDKLTWDNRVKEHFWLPTDAEVTIDTFYERLHPDDRELARRAVSEAIANNTTFDVEYRTMAHDGRFKWIRALGHTFYDAAGVAKHFDGLTLDITAAKGSQDALRQSEERLLAFMNASSYIMYRMSPDWTELRQLDGQGFISDAQGPKRDWMDEYIHPDDHAKLDEAIQKAVQTKGVFELEHRIRRLDGTTGWTLSRAVPLLNSQGEIVEWFGAASDVTARREAEERERQITAEAVAATAKFRALFEQTSVFAGIMTLDGILQDANKVSLEVCGYRAEDVLGRLFWETAWWRNSPESREKIRAAAPRAAQGIPYREVLAYSWADGTERLCEFALYPIVDDGGKVIFLHPTGFDITELKGAEEKYRTLAETLDAQVRQRTAEVVQQSEQLRDLSSRLLQAQDEERRHIARELHDSAGQILAALSISLAQISEKLSVDSARRAGRFVQDSEQLVQQLSQEIRTMSYLLHPPLLEERGLVEALRWYINGLVERSRLKVELQAPDDFERLPNDLELVMFRLVQECLTNIHRHSGSDVAEISLSTDAESIYLEVQDRGKGISPEKLGDIDSRGSGVGIRGMRERVRQYEGHMGIHSGTGGTKISFQFPLMNTAAQDNSAKA
jgi:PAS domain S-box-containing protein